MTKTTAAFFGTAAEAERAAEGLPADVGGVRGEASDATRSGELSRLSIPGEGMAAFDEGIRRGGAVLHAQVPGHRFDAAAGALERGGAVGIDGREAAWRREGWTGAAARPTTGHGAATGTARTGGGEEQRIPIVAGDEAFRERTVEAAESAEEAVVGKEARVTEEVVVRRRAEERAEAVWRMLAGARGYLVIGTAIRPWPKLPGMRHQRKAARKSFAVPPDRNGAPRHDRHAASGPTRRRRSDAQKVAAGWLGRGGGRGARRRRSKPCGPNSSRCPSPWSVDDRERGCHRRRRLRRGLAPRTHRVVAGPG